MIFTSGTVIRTYLRIHYSLYISFSLWAFSTKMVLLILGRLTQGILVYELKVLTFPSTCKFNERYLNYFAERQVK